MKKRLIILTSLIISLTPINILAADFSTQDTIDTKTYSDDTVSFNYNADFSAKIILHQTTDFTQYAITTNANNEYQNGFLLLSIRNYGAYNDLPLDWKDYIAPLESNDKFTVDIINSDKYREVYMEYTDSSSFPSYHKILDYNDHNFMFVNFTLSENEDTNCFLQDIYNSIDVSEGYSLNGHSFSDNSELTIIHDNLSDALIQ